MDCPGILSPTWQGIILKNKSKNNLKELLQWTQYKKIMWISHDTCTYTTHIPRYIDLVSFSIFFLLFDVDLPHVRIQRQHLGLEQNL